MYKNKKKIIKINIFLSLFNYSIYSTYKFQKQKQSKKKKKNTP